MRKRSSYRPGHVARIFGRTVNQVRDDPRIRWVRNNAGHRYLPHDTLMRFMKEINWPVPSEWLAEDPKGMPINSVIMYEQNHFWICRRLLRPESTGTGLTMREAYDDLLSMEKSLDKEDDH